MRYALAFLAALLLTDPSSADHHAGHHAHGPNGGSVVKLGDSDFQAEVLALRQEVFVRVFDKDMKPVAVDAKEITLTFTEPDGEKEDYGVPANASVDVGGVFARKSGHLVMHVMRDKMSVKLNAGGKSLVSKTFRYSHGPNGGDVFSLGKSGLVAELVVKGDIVRIHVLNGKKRPTQVDAKQITLTFTESDGEKEDYQVPVKVVDIKGSVFERNDDHVVEHLMRDETTIKLKAKGGIQSSKTFNYGKH